MALTDEGGMNTTMLVGPTGAAPYANNGFGNMGGDWAWFILILLLAGNGGWGGFGGFGGMGGFAADGAVLYPWMNQSNQINNGFRDQLINDNITEIRSGVTGLANQLCNSTSSVQMALSNGFAGVEQGANARQMANMQTAFGMQTAITQGLNDVALNLQNCCCENRANIADLKYTVATENCADRQALSDGVRDILTATQAQTQAILNQLCQDKIEAKNDTIAQLRSELIFARGQASQDVQTAAIQAGQRNLANEVEQYVAPRAVPAYVVQNPNCCAQNLYGCGCGA